MNSTHTWYAPLLTLALAACLVGCGADESQSQVGETAVAQADNVQVMAEPEAVEVPAMPEGLEVTGRFADMFITEITSDFNPGLQIGDRFPGIRAMYAGEEIMSIDRFIRDKGAIFIAARSVDW